MSELPRLHHIGIAVKTIKQALSIYQNLGFETTPAELLPRHNFKVAWVFTGTASLELMEPVDSNGPVAKFINSRGEGIHHLAFAVSDLEQTVEKLQNLGYILTDYNKTGYKDWKIAFLHPKSTGKTLIELLENSD